MKNVIREYIFITIGNILVAAGIYYFLVPSNLAAGGVSGLAMIIAEFAPTLPIGLLMLLMNAVLFVIAFIVLGSNFGAKTIYSSLSLSGLIWIMEKLFPITQPIAGDMFIELVFGILVSAIGMGIVFNQNASTGGTDIIAKIISKYMHLDIGKSLLLTDLLITIGAVFTFNVRTGMYAMLGVIINGFVIDSVLEGLNACKHVEIISTHPEKIKRYILDHLSRGATIYTAKGAFTDESKEIVTTIIGRREVVRLKNYIKSIDKRAFMTIINAHETLGEGFKDIDQ